MAAQSPRRRAPAEAPASKFVKCSVSLDVATHARLSAAAALAGLDKSAYMSRAIHESLKGIVVIDRRKSDDHVDPASGGRSESGEAVVE